MALADTAVELDRLYHQFFGELSEQAKQNARTAGEAHRRLLQLSDAWALIRWCYHDSEKMPENYGEIIAAAKAAV